MLNRKFRLIPVILVLVTLLLPVLSSCTGNSTTTTTTTTPPATTPGLTLLPTAAGVDVTLLYSSQCASCHGVNRQGGVAPALTDVSNFSTAFLSTFISVHVTGVGMPELLRNSLANYLKQNSVAANPSPTFSIDPQVLYNSNCALCHGASRTGGLGGPDITLIHLGNYPDASRLTDFIGGHFSGQDLSQDRRSILATWLLTP